jgi:hypothetical protein
MRHSNDIGKRVRITQDCRDGSPANGMYGIYEGDFPVGAVVNDRGKYHTYDYDAFVKWNEAQPNPIPELEKLIAQEPKYEGSMQDWKPPVRDYPVWFAETNPRMKLDDGSTIWGYECWWALIDKDDPPMEVLQKGQQETVDLIKAVFNGTNGEAMGEELKP